MTKTTARERMLFEALRPFANFADHTYTVDEKTVITNGSGFAKRQLTMGDCYAARNALVRFNDDWGQDG